MSKQPPVEASVRAFKFWISLLAGIAYIALEVSIHIRCGISIEVIEKEGERWRGCPYSPFGKRTISFMEMLCKSGLSVAIVATLWEIVEALYQGTFYSEYGVGINRLRGPVGMMVGLFIAFTCGVYIYALVDHQSKHSLFTAIYIHVWQVMCHFFICAALAGLFVSAIEACVKSAMFAMHGKPAEWNGALATMMSDLLCCRRSVESEEVAVKQAIDRRMSADNETTYLKASIHRQINVADQHTRLDKREHASLMKVATLWVVFLCVGSLAAVSAFERIGPTGQFVLNMLEMACYLASTYWIVMVIVHMIGTGTGVPPFFARPCACMHACMHLCTSICLQSQTCMHGCVSLFWGDACM